MKNLKGSCTMKNKTHYVISQEQVKSCPVNVLQKKLSNRKMGALLRLLAAYRKFPTIKCPLDSIANTMKVSRRTAQRYLEFFCQEGLLSKQKSSNIYDTVAYYFWDVLLQGSVLSRLKSCYAGFMSIALLASVCAKSEVGLPIRLDVNYLFKKQSGTGPSVGTLSLLVNQSQEDGRDVPSHWRYKEYFKEKVEPNTPMTYRQWDEVMNLPAVPIQKESTMPAFNLEQLKQITTYPKDAVEYADYVLNKRMLAGDVPNNIEAFYFGVLRNYDPKRHRKNPSRGTSQNFNNQQAQDSSYQRPSQGPRAIYEHQERQPEDPVNGYRKIEEAVHSGKITKAAAVYPNLYEKCVSEEIKQQIMKEVHQGCECRQNVDSSLDLMNLVSKTADKSKDGTSYTKYIQEEPPYDTLMAGNTDDWEEI